MYMDIINDEMTLSFNCCVYPINGFTDGICDTFTQYL